MFLGGSSFAEWEKIETEKFVASWIMDCISYLFWNNFHIFLWLVEEMEIYQLFPLKDLFYFFNKFTENSHKFYDQKAFLII